MANRQSRVLARRLKQVATLAPRMIRRPGVASDTAGALLRGRFGAARRIAITMTRTPDLGAEKIVSSKYRYLWICNPKVASRSIISTLRRADPCAEIIRNKSVSEIYGMRPEARDYFSFAFIRHPFDRALSLYSEIRFSPERYEGAQRIHKKEKRQTFFDRCYGLSDVSSFDDYCRWLNTPYGIDAHADPHFLSQHILLRLPGGRLPDFVGRLENIDEDFRQVAERAGMPPPSLPMLNTMAGWRAAPDQLKTARSSMRARLTRRSRELLSARYAADMELGGYSPD